MGNKQEDIWIDCRKVCSTEDCVLKNMMKERSDRADQTGRTERAERNERPNRKETIIRKERPNTLGVWMAKF